MNEDELALSEDVLPDGLAPSEAHEALAHPERRRLLAVLDRLETPERFSALTRGLAAAREDRGATKTERIRARLHHAHVPKLEDLGLVDVDWSEETVALTEAGEELVAATFR